MYFLSVIGGENESLYIVHLQGQAVGGIAVELFRKWNQYYKSIRHYWLRATDLQDAISFLTGFSLLRCNLNTTKTLQCYPPRRAVRFIDAYRALYFLLASVVQVAHLGLLTYSPFTEMPSMLPTIILLLFQLFQPYTFYQFYYQ